uniref:Uncharacterized protein n=1 Tax=Meloidogyne javanica TaxID=6303 RepID=A0A915LER8_MELJA
MNNDEMDKDLNNTANLMSNLSLDRNTKQHIHNLYHRLNQITREIGQINNLLSNARAEYASIMNQDPKSFDGEEREQLFLANELERKYSRLEANKENLEKNKVDIQRQLLEIKDDELSKSMSNLSINHRKDRGSGGSSSSSSTRFRRG